MTAIRAYLKKNTSAAPLAVFRIFFGLLIAGSILRFWAKGWIYELYIKPTFFFSFYGFEFVKPLGNYTYLLFLLCGLSALFVAMGLFYRMSSLLLFLSFTYIELIDKSTYLNHYYFISLLCLMLIFLPAHVHFSVDAWRKKQIAHAQIPQWNIDVIKLMMGILYFYAGLAKVNSDWLLEALPLKIWLPARNDVPVLGWLFNLSWIPYLFSWFGCLYDLSIPFLLWNAKTRPFAYLAVILFHVLTSILFPIGMFPYIMVVAATIFFSAEFHQKIINFLQRLFGSNQRDLDSQRIYPNNSLLNYGFALFFSIQLLFPFRYLLYPGELFWTEEGYRFSWRVMLMEKAGYAGFTIKDIRGNLTHINNSNYLSKLQEKMMATQPDMILQYAHHLRDRFSYPVSPKPEVYVDSYVTVNSRLGKPLISPTTNLSVCEENLFHKSWILPFSDEIKGF